LRLNGILLHAWNEIFYKLCVLECGRFLRSDSCSVEKERFDYARVLIAASSFEIINCFEALLIDGDMVKVKIIVEWGFNIGDDACLYEDGYGSNDAHSEHDDLQMDHGMDVNADLLVDKLVKDLVDFEAVVNHKEELAEAPKQIENHVGMLPRLLVYNRFSLCRLWISQLEASRRVLVLMTEFMLSIQLLI